MQPFKGKFKIDCKLAFEKAIHRNQNAELSQTYPYTVFILNVSRTNSNSALFLRCGQKTGSVKSLWGKINAKEMIPFTTVLRMIRQFLELALLWILHTTSKPEYLSVVC